MNRTATSNYLLVGNTNARFYTEKCTDVFHIGAFYVENQYGTRFLFDTYRTNWLTFEMELQNNDLTWYQPVSSSCKNESGETGLI